MKLLAVLGGFFLCALALVPSAGAAEANLITVQPHTMALGSTGVGVSIDRTVMVTNRVNEDVGLTTFEVFGSENGDWRLLLPETCNVFTVLAPGESCTFAIVVTPVESGKIRGTFCATGLAGRLFERQCGKIVGHAK